VALTKVAPALFGTGNNITSVTVGGSANTISLTFDGSGVITSASNNALLISNTAITGNIISSQITSVANTQITGNIISSQISPSISLTTPALGTPSALVLTNATGLPQAGLGTNVAGNGPAFWARKSDSQNISSDTVTKILFDTEVFDTNSNFASSRFTPTVAGYYLICCAIYWVNGLGSFVNLNIFKNGSVIVEVGRNTQASGVIGGSSVVYFNGSTDYVELYFYSASGTCLLGSNVAVVNFSGAMIRSA
jgi:hypothetical protein